MSNTTHNHIEINPYPKNVGFGLNLNRAEKAIKKLGLAPNANIYTRSFDNCFEMFDGGPIVWVLLHKAMKEPNTLGKNLLTRSIQEMFSSSLNGKSILPNGFRPTKKG